MDTQAYVDLLRKTLVINGAIRPNTPEQAKGPKVLQHGEWLVSLLSNDDHVRDFLTRTLRDPYFGKRMVEGGDSDTGYLLNFKDTAVQKLMLYIEFVKFYWLNYGTTATLGFVKLFGMYEWGLRDNGDLESQVDDLVSSAQDKLRYAGVKYRDMAEFFADPETVLLLQGVIAKGQ